MRPSRPIAAARAVAAMAAALAVTCSGPNAARIGDGRPTGPAAAAEESLVVLHTNDIHAHLMPFRAGGEGTLGGAARRAALIKRERTRAAAALLLDAGDVFQGTPMFNLFRGAPDYRSMSMMDYDAGALGNHELDLGPATWRRVAHEAARFPILSANVFASAESAWAEGLPEAPERLRPSARWVGGRRVAGGASLRYLATPYLIGSWGGTRVAILGLTTDEITRIVLISANGGVAVSDPIAVARRLVPELRRRADVVIALTHIGIAEDRRLAARVPGIDLIVGGHSHTRLDRPVFIPNAENKNGYHGTAIVQAGEWGARLGRTVLYLRDGSVTRATGGLLDAVAGEGEDPSVLEMLRPYQDSVAAATSRPIFESRADVTRSGLSQGETPLGNFVADAMREGAGADVAIQNAGGIRAPLPRGTVTMADVYAVLPFDNRLVTVSMEGWRLRNLLDFIARRLGQGGFAQVSGVSFVIRGDRASQIRVGGEALDGARVYRVATNSFLYEGGDGYDSFREAGPAQDTGVLVRDAAVTFLLRHPDYVFKKEGRMRWEGAMRLPAGMLGR